MNIIVQNLAVEYQDDGVGKVILFLHGWQDDLHTFDVLATFLSQKNRVVRLDFPGFGRSETPAEAWDLDDYVRFVSDFIKKLDIQVDVLVGHSFGGRIIMKGIATEKLRARKLVLIGSAGIARRHTARNTILWILAKLGWLIISVPPLIFWRDKIRKQVYGLIGSDYLDAGTLKETFLNIISEDLGECAKKIITPTLLIWGADDTETPLSDGERLSRLIHNSKLKVIDGAGHFVHRERPQETARLIQAFL